MDATSVGMPGAQGTYDFVISRSANDDHYAVWRFNPGADQLLTKVTPTDPSTPAPTFDHTHQMAAVGKYLLEWGPIQLRDYEPCYPYRLFELDPGATDPLAGYAVCRGAWRKEKFWASRPDFGNPTGAKKDYDESVNLVLIALPNFVLNMIPTPGRGTYSLWTFDPDPANGYDPLPTMQTPQGAFRTIQMGHTLLPVGNFVLDWLPRTPDGKTGEYWVWSFDPELNVPLVAPAQQHGRWDDIDDTHQLVVVGNRVLDWVTADRSYRLWEFDPDQANPLSGPIDQGDLPEEFTEQTTLLGVQPAVPVDEAAASRPGTVDFMRQHVKHFVYYMLENRSFDHVLGWLHSRQEGQINFIGSNRPFDGASTENYNLDTAGEKIHQSVFDDWPLSDEVDLEFFTYDPYHDAADVLEQMFFRDPDGYADKSDPNMGGFVYNNGAENVMWTYTPEQLPVINGLAREFAVSDAWFCSMPSCTDPNRGFGLTGSALNQLNNFQNGSTYEYWPISTHRPSIFKALWSNGIEDWKIYNSIQWMSFVHTYHLFLQGQIGKVDANTPQFISHIDQFFDDAKAGTLPAFSFLEPVWIGMSGTSSYHPGADPIAGEQRLKEIYDAISSGPGWEQTVLVITFDEHGGIYDHVPPPRAVNPWPNDEIDGFRFDVLGPRVPTIVVSPYIERQTVFRSGGPVAYEHTSILSTLLQWFGVPKARWGLGERTARAPSFEGLLERTVARDDKPRLETSHDKYYPRSGEAAVENRPLTDQDRLMIPRLVWSLTDDLDASQSHDVAVQAMADNDLASVTAALNRLAGP
jgi:phospholipase C